MIVYFIRGLPGSGKSTLAEELYEFTNYDAKWIEADHWMTAADGSYEWDPSRLEEVHANCRAEYLRAMEHKQPSIIVSNTSSEKKYVDWYQEEAEKHGYTFVSLIVENRHGNKSVHNVPEASMEKIRRRFDVKL
jgi:predicted ABC-type ATPase